MTRSRSITFLAGAVAVPLTALAVSGCGGGGGGSASAAHPAKAKPATAPAMVKVANSGLGSKILVDSQGRTLYMFSKDSGTSSSCTGACAVAWPPVAANGKPTVGPGANASLLGTTTRSDGTSQVTYNGHPLYRFVKDTAPDQTHGEGLTAFGVSWFAVSPAGKRVSKPASTSSNGSSNGPTSSQPTTPAPPPPPAPKPAPRPVAPKATPPANNNGIPQNNGGDQDSDNNGGPSDGDGGV
jgi:predicted lipoprotein with Yx(FWY)xxD motif